MFNYNPDYPELTKVKTQKQLFFLNKIYFVFEE